MIADGTCKLNILKSTVEDLKPQFVQLMRASATSVIVHRQFALPSRPAELSALNVIIAEHSVYG